MPEYYYQIKIQDGHNSFMYPVAVKGIAEAEDKTSLCRWLESEYPEYFEGNKVAQKLSKKTEQIVFVTIFPLTDYWKEYWTSSVECVTCGKQVPLIEIQPNLGEIYLPTFTCCPECRANMEQALQQRKEDNYDEYWSKRCGYYYIYKITHKTNGKCYIGYTEREPVFRWWEHLKHSDLPIGQALQSEGIQMFTFEILECHSKDSKTKQEMHEIETNYILTYDSINNGYNCVVSKSVSQPTVKQHKLFDDSLIDNTQE